MDIFFSDLSCSPPNSFQKIESLGILNFVPMDWMALISITQKKVSVDGEKNYKNLNSNKIIELIKSKTEELFKTDSSHLFNFRQENDRVSMMLIPIRSNSHYKVFFVCISDSETYHENTLQSFGIIIKLLYENILINNVKFQEDNYLANILNSTDSVVISTDLEGVITTANSAALKFYRTKQMIGKNISDFFQNKDNKSKAVIAQVASSNKCVRFKELLLTTHRGRQHVVNFSVSPLHNSKNYVVGVVIIGSDITAKRVLERQLEQLKQFALLGEVAAGVAHDIKNPLMSIRGCSKILQKTLHERLDCQEYLEPIIQQVDRINEVVEQLLAYGRIAEESNYTIVDINEILEKSINVIHFHRNLKHIVVEKQLAEELPFVQGHNVQLQQAFINILINAVQAIKQEGTITINSRYIESEKSILISISDNGEGIKAKDIKIIFRPFYTTKQPSRGLGLSIVDRVIKAHRGKIVIHSKFNIGTTFDVLLPCEARR